MCGEKGYSSGLRGQGLGGLRYIAVTVNLYLFTFSKLICRGTQTHPIPVAYSEVDIVTQVLVLYSIEKDVSHKTFVKNRMSYC